MFYRVRRAAEIRRFDRAIAGILESRPISLEPAPWSIVSMVANHDVSMYLTAIKSFYRRLGQGNVIAIIDRDMPSALRETLSAHLLGLEYVILEEIPTGPCQRGGTWERLLYCLDRSESEYTIQLDSDTLTVGRDLDEVSNCLRENRAFTMSDGFVRMPLPEAAASAQATPSNYIGIVTEAAFAQYPDAAALHYVRGSSGFAGFSRGGFTRAAISNFHQEMERLVGVGRWREWGSEQCGSNFAIANSPDPVVLRYPEYSSFTARTLRSEVKLFHFIGASRFKDGYFAHRSRDEIAALVASVPPSPAPEQSDDIGEDDGLPLLFARNLTWGSAAKYLGWRLAARRYAITVQMRTRHEFQDHPGPGPKLQLRAAGSQNNDFGVAYEIFVHRFLMPPVWIPPERVELIVDLGANVGMSCLWWLANYWRAQVIGFEPHPNHASQARTNIALNGYGPRIVLQEAAAGSKSAIAWITDQGACSQISESEKAGFKVSVLDLFESIGDQRIGILKIDIEGSEVELLEDPRFGALDIQAIVMEWHEPDDSGRGGKSWCIDKLRRLGYRTYVTHSNGAFGMVWAYRSQEEKRSVTPRTARLPITALIGQI